MANYLKKFAAGIVILTVLISIWPEVAMAADVSVGNVSPMLSRQGCVRGEAVPADQTMNLTVVLKPGTGAAALTDWLNENGLTVNQSLNDGLVLRCSAGAATVEKALGVNIYNYTYGEQSFFANDTSPVLPADLAPGINGIFGLDSIRVVKSMHRQTQIDTSKQSNHENIQSLNLTGRTANTVPYIPAEIQKAYGFDQVYAQGIDGSGVTAAVVTFAAYNPSDINKFFSDLGISAGGGIEVINVDGGSGPVDFKNGGSVETSMDIENLLSSAPGCRLLVYESDNSGSSNGMIDAMSQLVSDNQAKVVSLSWGFDDSLLTRDYYNSLDTILAAGAAEGITFVGASGDDGGGYPVYPSDDPYFTSVGGTSLALNQSDGAVVQETGWSGSGGGSSTVIPLPAWQSGANMPSANARMSPDVAFDADPETGYALYYDGAWNYANGISDGGTSAAAPEVAASMVLADEALAKEQKAYLGAVNQQLYSLAQSGKNDFKTITSGNNGLYQCGSSYNMVTGWGVPQVNNLVMDLSGTGQTPQVSLSLNTSNPQTGSSVSVRAAGSGIINPQYQFWVENPRDQSWFSSGAYSSSSTYQFIPQVPGQFQVMVYARPVGGTDAQTVQSQLLPINVSAGKTQVSALTVAGPSGNLNVDSSASFNAVATDPAGVPMYQFWLHDTNGWRVVQDYSSNAGYTLSNLQPGSYVVAVYALDQTDIQAGNWNAAFYQSFVINVGSGVTINLPAAAGLGSTVNVSALASNITGVQYQFWYRTPAGSWQASGDYQSEGKFNFTATASGIYQVVVYAKDLYAPNTAQFALYALGNINVS